MAPEPRGGGRGQGAAPEQKRPRHPNPAERREERQALGTAQEGWRRGRSTAQSSSILTIYMGAGCSGAGELRTGQLEWRGNRDHGNCRHESLSRWPPDLRRGERGNGADQLASWAVSRLAAHVRR